MVDKRKESDIEGFKSNITDDYIDVEVLLKYSSEFTFTELLAICSHCGVKIKVGDQFYDIERISTLYQLMYSIYISERKQQQREGIEKALIRKAEGRGVYGRPRIALPEDFEEQIRKRFEINAKLAEYQKELGMSKSTFYKWARFYIYEKHKAQAESK